MKTLMILFGMIVAAPAFAACGASGTPVIDWGLHREYRIVRDCAHPERPASLVEVPWSEAAARRQRDSVHANPSGLRPAEQRSPYLVRAGTRVTLAGQTSEGAIRLVGIALEQGRAGDSIRVKAGFHGATLPGIVRGQGLVELEPLKGRN
jgi:hypothetical protein